MGPSARGLRFHRALAKLTLADISMGVDRFTNLARATELHSQLLEATKLFEHVSTTRSVI